MHEFDRAVTRTTLWEDEEFVDLDVERAVLPLDELSEPPPEQLLEIHRSAGSERSRDMAATERRTTDAGTPGATAGATPVDAGVPIICPACGGANPADAVFCGKPECHKALGEFRYVREELARKARWHEVVADKVADFIGKPQFLVVHGLWFALWVTINTGLIAMLHAFDAYPFGLLGIILSIEAIFITGFLLISQNRQGAHADERAELDYEVNVRTYRRLNEIDAMLRDVVARLDRLDAAP